MMAHRVIILDVAKTDFREIKAYVTSQFGGNVWSEVNEEFKSTMKAIGLNPGAGTEIADLKELGIRNFRSRLVRQTRIVYEFDESEVLVHMFLHTKRDFRSHLINRLLGM